MTHTPYKIVSLFSGCGGTDLGFIGGFDFLGKTYKKLPFEIIWANDINDKACVTYKNNIGDHIVCGDIWEIDYSTIPQADIVLGGFPCQDFSLAGKRRGFENEKRGKLYLAMKKVIESTNPKIFVAENVKGLLSMNNGGAIKQIEEDFKHAGYKIETHLVNTADYGIPQNRERVLIIGIRNDLDVKLEFPKKTHSEQGDLLTSKYVSSSEALSDMEQLDEYGAPNNGWSKAKLFPGTQGNSKIKADRPAPTMRAEHHGNIEFHYKLNRRLSAREAARIQSFPDNFIFYKSTSDAYRQIGNAVAPVLAWHLASQISQALSGKASI